MDTQSVVILIASLLGIVVGLRLWNFRGGPAEGRVRLQAKISVIGGVLLLAMEVYHLASGKPLGMF